MLKWGPKRDIMTSGTWRSQTVMRRAQNKPIYSLHHAPKQITHRPKILSKIMAFKRGNEASAR